MARVIPVLGSAGFATDMTIKADEAMSNFYISQRSQSDMYRGSIASLGEIISRLGNNTVDLPTEIQRVLGAYLERQFDQVDLTVKSDVNGSSIDLRITAILRDGNRSIDVAHVVAASDSKIRSIIDLQNNGKPIFLADS
jgi:hypothetical protein